MSPRRTFLPLYRKLLFSAIVSLSFAGLAAAQTPGDVEREIDRSGHLDDMGDQFVAVDVLVESAAGAGVTGARRRE